MLAGSKAGLFKRPGVLPVGNAFKLSGIYLQLYPLYDKNNLNGSRRLFLAAAGAMAAHIILFALGHLSINLLAVPSDINRVTVLTLESSSLDGLREADSRSTETLNDAQIGNAESVSARDEPSDLTQLTASPVPEPATELETQADKQLVSATARQDESVNQAVTPEPALSTNTTAAESPRSAEMEQQSETPAPAFEARSDLAILTTETDRPAVTINQDAPQTMPELSSIAVSKVQKRMIDKRIKKWAARLDSAKEIKDSIRWQHRGQTYVAKFSHLPASGQMDLDKIVVEVLTEHNGNRLAMTMQLKKLAFSNFAQFVHRWNPDISMHDDEMDGRFHSNSRINLDFDRDARPVFHGRVTTASYKVGFERFARKGTRQQIFRGGLETGVKKISMPEPRLNFDGPLTDRQANTRMFVEDTRIVFLPDGRYTSQTIGSENTRFTDHIGGSPLYLISAPQTTLHISGTVRGRVMVYSPRRVVIEGNLLYSNTNLDTSDDILGVVSDREVVVADADVTGPGDLHINA
ncbi:MAG: hypothetical protein HKN85_09085, partial [Gammaproteobacteria bacterium]|nr:hypothetical protein [Gammaproteobacteria bacterium]